MEYKNQIECENIQCRFEQLVDLHQADNDEIDEFSFYRYLIVLDAVIKCGDDDEIYKCLEELYENLENIEFIESPPKDYNMQRLILLTDLINNEDIDLIILSCQCISLIISKCDKIGFFYYYSKIMDLIIQKISNNENRALMYRFFDIICSLSSLDQNVLNSILKYFPVSLWIKLLKVNTIQNQFGQYLVNITSYENYDLEFQKSIFTIFLKIIKENQNAMFEPIAKSIKQMMNISVFDFNLFFEMNFQEFILSLLDSNNPNLIILSMMIISKSIHAHFYLEHDSISKILKYAKQNSELQIKCESLNCLSEIMKENIEISKNCILKDDFLNELLCFYETDDFNIQVKFCITDFFFNCLLFSDFQLCYSLIVNNEIFRLFSFLLNSDDSLVLSKLFEVFWRMIEMFECNHAFNDLSLKIIDQFPFDLLEAIRENLDQQYSILFDKVIEKIYSKTA